MGQHRAIIVGAGRIGAGFGWPEYPYTYTHADTYLKFKDRVELVAFVDPDDERVTAAHLKYGVCTWKDLDYALAKHKPDIVSVCVQPDRQPLIMEAISKAPTVKAAWVEKPYVSPIYEHPKRVLVNFIRRYDRLHRHLKDLLHGKQASLYVWGKDEIHTRSHFDDLARFWGIPKERYVYVDNSTEIPSTNSYVLDAGKWSVTFRNGGVEPGFMEAALNNLLNAVDFDEPIWSPPYA